jgi:hypothetical protein
VGGTKKANFRAMYSAVTPAGLHGTSRRLDIISDALWKAFIPLFSFSPSYKPQPSTRKYSISISLVISDDSFSISHLTRLVSVAALLSRYSPSTHPRLTLCPGLLSHVPALPSSDQLYLAKFCTDRAIYSASEVDNLPYHHIRPLLDITRRGQSISLVYPFP